MLDSTRRAPVLIACVAIALASEVAVGAEPCDPQVDGFSIAECMDGDPIGTRLLYSEHAKWRDTFGFDSGALEYEGAKHGQSMILDASDLESPDQCVVAKVSNLADYSYTQLVLRATPGASEDDAPTGLYIAEFYRQDETACSWTWHQYDGAWHGISEQFGPGNCGATGSTKYFGACVLGTGDETLLRVGKWDKWPGRAAGWVEGDHTFDDDPGSHAVDSGTKIGLRIGTLVEVTGKKPRVEELAGVTAPRSFGVAALRASPTYSTTTSIPGTSDAASQSIDVRNVGDGTTRVDWSCSLDSAEDCNGPAAGGTSWVQVSGGGSQLGVADPAGACTITYTGSSECSAGSLYRWQGAVTRTGGDSAPNSPIAIAGSLYAGPTRFQERHVIAWPGQIFAYPETEQETAFDFIAQRITMAQGHKEDVWAPRNPDIESFEYTLDLYMCSHQHCTFDWPTTTEDEGVPESYFLHFAEDTTIEYTTRSGEKKLVTIPGCPAPSPVTRECRMATWIWDDVVWPYDHSNAEFRAWMAKRLVGIANAAKADGIFLDAHFPSFAQSMFYQVYDDVRSGGKLREYGGAHIGSKQVEDSFQRNIALSLAADRRALVENGTPHLFINCWLLWDTCQQQQLAAGGFHSEQSFLPTSIDADQLEDIISHVEELTRTPYAVADLAGSSCYWGGASYLSSDPGNYSTAKKRYIATAYAMFLSAREPAGSPGHAYYDGFECHGVEHEEAIPGKWQDFQSEWLPMFDIVQLVLGEPLGPAFRAQQGAVPAPENASCENGSWAKNRYAVFRREYEGGIVLFRPRDGWACGVFGDSTAVTVRLGGVYRRVREDGSIGEPVTELVLRNSEGVVLLPGDAP